MSSSSSFSSHKGFRYVEALVVGLVLLIGGCFALEIFWSKPDAAAVFAGFVPTSQIFTNHEDATSPSASSAPR